MSKNIREVQSSKNIAIELQSIHSVEEDKNEEYLSISNIKYAEQIIIARILKELLLRRSHHQIFRYSSIIYEYLLPELNQQDSCISLIPKEIQEKAKNSFWYAFSFFIGQDFIEEFFHEQKALFEERGIIYDMAFAHSYKMYLKTLETSAEYTFN